MKQVRLVGILYDTDELIINDWKNLSDISIEEIISDINCNNFNYYDWYLEYRQEIDGMKRLKIGMIYKIKDLHGFEGYGVYMGKQKDFGCCICDKGCNCKTFNILHGNSIEEGLKNKDEKEDYETFGYGNDHFPEVEETGIMEYQEDKNMLYGYVRVSTQFEESKDKNQTFDRQLKILTD